MALDERGIFNVSKTVGWSPPDEPPRIPSLGFVKTLIAKTDMNSHVAVCALACGLLIIWRYSDPPRTEEQRDTLRLIIDEYEGIRAKAERRIVDIRV